MFLKGFRCSWRSPLWLVAASGSADGSSHHAAVVVTERRTGGHHSHHAPGGFLWVTCTWHFYHKALCWLGSWSRQHWFPFGNMMFWSDETHGRVLAHSTIEWLQLNPYKYLYLFGWAYFSYDPSFLSSQTKLKRDIHFVMSSALPFVNYVSHIAKTCIGRNFNAYSVTMHWIVLTSLAMWLFDMTD